jgi:hypothetical protein
VPATDHLAGRSPVFHRENDAVTTLRQRSDQLELGAAAKEGAEVVGHLPEAETDRPHGDSGLTLHERVEVLDALTRDP